jgi:sec-independent protein translocase protein TatB
MFEIGWTELVLIAVVAIVVIGPKDLPRAMRTVGQWAARLKRMGREFQGQFNEALKEAELDGVQKDLQSLSRINPLETVRREVKSLEASIRKDTAMPSVPTFPPAPTGGRAVPPVPAVLPAEPAAPAVPVAPKVET